MPVEPYVFAEWRIRRVGIDYLVEVEKHYCNVPFRLARQEVEARITAHTVEIFMRGERVASHLRSGSADAGREETRARIGHRADPASQHPQPPLLSIGDRHAVPSPIGQLGQLGLAGMAEAFAEIEASSEVARLTHPEWLSLPIEREVSHRRDPRLAARLRYAKLRHQDVVEDVDYKAPRGLDRVLFRKLCSGDFITAHDNLILTGPTGVGKS